MGEVRVVVRLSNAADMALVRRNLMQPMAVRSVEADALVDTGAVTFVLPSLVVERLELARPFKQVAEYADGRREEVDVTEWELRSPACWSSSRTQIGTRRSASSVLDWLRGVNGIAMRAAKRRQHDDGEMRPEYDFSGAVRGKYAARFARSSNVVVLAPDVASVFKNAKAVNDALRTQLRKKPRRKRAG